MPQSIEVYFLGLICHIGLDNAFGRTNAALIKTDNHVPKVVIGVTDSAPMKIDLIEGDILSLSVGEDEAVADTQFETYVPSLLEKTDKLSGQQALKHDVRKSKNFDVAIAYFKHAKSSLGVAELYRKQAVYRLNRKPDSKQCVARVTLATITTSDTDVYLICANGQTENRYPVQDGWVLVVNQFHPHAFGTSSQHFGQHLKLTDATEIARVDKDGNCGQASRVSNGIHLDDVRPYIYLPLEPNRGGSVHVDATQVECSNTRWP